MLFLTAQEGDDSNFDPTSYFFGFMGAASALVFANLGSAYGTAKSGVGICSMGVLKPELIMKSVIPVVMAGILGIYGFIVSVLLGQNITPDKFTNIEKTGDEFYKGYAYLAAGLCCGFSSLVRKILLLMPVLAIIPHLSFLNLLRLLVWLLVLSVMLVSALVTVGVGEDFGSE